MTLKLHPRTPPEVVAVLSDRERLAELLATRTQDEVCEFVGCGHISLRKAMDAHGIVTRPRGRKIERNPAAITREDVKRLVWRAYWRADRCPPDCPGRGECLQGECKLGQILEGERNGKHDGD